MTTKVPRTLTTETLEQVQTVVALTGTAPTLPAIPAGINEFTLDIANMSTNGTSIPILRLNGQTSYNGSVAQVSTGVSPSASMHLGGGYTGIGLAFNWASTRSISGQIIGRKQQGSNLWVMEGLLHEDTTTPISYIVGANIDLGGTELSSLLFRTVNGTDAYDAGTLTVSWRFPG